MEVILLEKIDNLGTIGDRVKVRSGYGRNYLLPKGKATLALSMPIGISQASKNKEAAWEFLKWVTNPDLEKEPAPQWQATSLLQG